ncbi:MAG: cytochrome o ubiquinol oxidase subunit [Pseudomonas sp.]|nr:cytochrome o ubiquinol oxidase subunit [Pseudomonas sp.]
MNANAHVPSGHEAEPRLFGFWIFLMSDALIFALLFALYATMTQATDAGPTTREVFDLKSSLTETLLLLLSSFTFGMASLNLKYRPAHPRYLVGWLVLTLTLGLAFVALELHDFMAMAAQGAVPQRSGFLSAFFALVSTHGLHVTAGCLWLLLMLVQLKVFGLDETVKLRLMCLGLFWHFLDVIWVAIYAVVYLRGLI